MRYIAELTTATTRDRTQTLALSGAAKGIDKSSIDCLNLSDEGTRFAWMSLTEERLLFVITGTVEVWLNGDSLTLTSGGFVFMPRGLEFTIVGAQGAGTTLLDIRADVEEPVASASRRPLAELGGQTRKEAFSLHTGHTAEGRAFDTQTLIDRKAGSERIKAFMSLVHPGSGMGLHVHPFDQFYYLLDGTLAVRLGFSDARLTAGNLVAFPAGLVHSNVNEGRAATLLLTINVPEVPAGAKGAFPIDLTN